MQPIKRNMDQRTSDDLPKIYRYRNKLYHKEDGEMDLVSMEGSKIESIEDESEIEYVSDIMEFSDERQNYIFHWMLNAFGREKQEHAFISKCGGIIGPYFQMKEMYPFTDSFRKQFVMELVELDILIQQMKILFTYEDEWKQIYSQKMDELDIHIERMVHD